MKRSKFSLSNYKLFSCDMGELIPCGLTEVLPGDTIQHSTNALVRTQPLLAPVMHPVQVRIHHWYVPLRLIWDDFEKFITGGPDGMDDTVFPTKNMLVEPINAGNLGDYLGLPLGFNTFTSALPFRAYNTIYNEWYRDQDLAPELNVSTGSGEDVVTEHQMRNVAWERGLFHRISTLGTERPGNHDPIRPLRTSRRTRRQSYTRHRRNSDRIRRRPKRSTRRNNKPNGH